MSDSVIRVEGLGKKYRIHHQRQERYTALRDVVTHKVRSMLNVRGSGAPRGASEDFWALKDIAFEVNRGDVVGVIGRNGAGKSTLLKILSRVTEPTEGRAALRGRAASLLEVGTGFHPELTGRENVYLNGAILGMARAEIKRKFDEIVAFAEVEQFLDTPVKRYSSGMYVRLAFAVAAHLEPEILIVDEVLAVGDAKFQAKCLGKMHDVSTGGRTVLFVSHNMGAVRGLCSTGILLERGRIRSRGDIDSLIREYNEGGAGSDATTEYVSSAGQERAHFTRIRVTQDGNAASVFRIDRPLRVEFEYDPKDASDAVVTLVLRNTQGVWVHHSTDEFSDELIDRRAGRRTCEVPAYALAADEYFVTAALGARYGELYEKLGDVARFTVEFTGTMSDRTPAAAWKGVCGPGLLRWA
jgi:lipopolysaccharide transport system ATP-binding protein